jgi:hypothetical protein
MLTRRPIFVDQVFLNPDVPLKYVSDEAIGERTFRVEHSEHFAVFDRQHTDRRNGCGR